DVWRRAQRVEYEKYLIFFHQFARLFHCLGRVVAVVVRDEVDLAAIDAALVVDHFEVSGLGLADCPVGRGRSGVRHDVADLDFGVGGTGVVFLLRQRRSTDGGDRQSGQDQAQGFQFHGTYLLRQSSTNNTRPTSRSAGQPCLCAVPPAHPELAQQTHDPGGHQVHQAYEQYTVYRLRRRLGDVLGDVWNELEEEGPKKGAGNGRQTAHHQPNQQEDGKLNRETVGRYVGHCDRTQGAGHAGAGRRYAKGERLEQGQIDTHGGGGNGMVAHGHQRTPNTSPQQIPGQQKHDCGHRQAEEIQPAVRIERHAKKLHLQGRLGLVQDNALNAAGESLDHPVLQ